MHPDVFEIFRSPFSILRSSFVFAVFARNSTAKAQLGHATTAIHIEHFHGPVKLSASPDASTSGTRKRDVSLGPLGLDGRRRGLDRDRQTLGGSSAGRAIGRDRSGPVLLVQLSGIDGG